MHIICIFSFIFLKYVFSLKNYSNFFTILIIYNFNLNTMYEVTELAIDNESEFNKPFIINREQYEKKKQII